MFAAAVVVIVFCELAFFMTGYYKTENAVASGWQNNHFQRTTDGSSSELMSKPILVMYWTSFFSAPDWKWGEGSSPLSSCSELAGRCEFTSNHSRIEGSDILLFHMRDVLNLPMHRLPHQKWVFAVLESPSHTYVNLPDLQGVFNLTMTYARSAHVSWCYGRCEPMSKASHPNYSKIFNYAARKKHLVSWFVANCHTPSRRETYVQLLGKHIDVHKYGCGGNYSCPRRNVKVCYSRLLNDNYKFYLSFENSICRDYVTEKLWRILQINVVPIVLGNASYSDLLPPHSYIDVRDFASPRHLADYLKLLDANDALYNEYFHWKAKYVCEAKSANNGCALCRHALAKRGQTEVVRDLVAEWGRAQNCVNPKQYYRGMDKYR